MESVEPEGFMAALVTVYAYRRWERSKDRMVLAPHKATRAAIKAMLRTELLADSGLQVSRPRRSRRIYRPASGDRNGGDTRLDCRKLGTLLNVSRNGLSCRAAFESKHASLCEDDIFYLRCSMIGRR